MNATSPWTIYTDGGSRGNPGPAAYAYVIKRPGEADVEEKCFLGVTTNNIAEYTGLVQALEHALQLGGRQLIVHSDSELMVKQLNGLYRVKNEGLLPLYQQAQKLRPQFESVLFKHVRREHNAQADALCNEAMDHPRDARPRTTQAQANRSSDPGSLPAVANSSAQNKPPPQPPTISARQQALEVLRQNALQWAESGDPTDPEPADVLRQIWHLLHPHDPSS